MKDLSPRFLLVLGLIASLTVGCQGGSAPSPEKGPDKKVEQTTKAQPKAPAKNLTSPAAGTESGKSEQASCSPKKGDRGYTQSDCAASLVCLPNVDDLNNGTCRVSCGQLVKGKPKKVEGKCGPERTCQMATTLTLDELGAYCLPQQTKRDGACSALSDKDACSDNRICAVSEVKKAKKDGKEQQVATSFICRDSCAFGTPKAHDSCSMGEKCVAYPYDSTGQTAANGDPVMCTESKCTGDFKDCECNRGEGFQCTPLIQGVVAFCDRPAGICTTPVAFASAADFEDGRYSGETCNEVKGHAFCNNSLFEGIEKSGEALCVVLSEKSGDGFCFGFCSAPAVDLDGDGKLKGREAGQKLACPANYTCNTELGRKLGMIAPVGDKSAPNGKKACDPAKCEAGKPCPSECGIGDAECLSFPKKGGGSLNFCGAPFGNCELSATPR